MVSGWPRALFAVLVTGAYVALGAASADREFAWVEEGPGGVLRSAPTAERVVGGWLVGLAGGSVLVRLPEGRTAERLPVRVAIVGPGRERLGAGTFAVDEAGAYLAGRLEAEVEGVPVRAGLRVRVQ
jgi:hypothetical protein